MANELDPIIGQWYLHHDKGEMFCVVALDPDERSVEIQFFDGDVEELTADQWRSLDVETCEPPEDWTGPYDDIERDDLGVTETGMTERDWRAPLEGVPPGEGPSEETTAEAEEEELDEWEEGRPQEPYLEEDDAAKRRAG